MSGRTLSKPWTPLVDEAIAAVPAQLGVYEIATDDGVVTRIGYAGGRQPFGLRSALDDERGGAGSRFRYELTHGYLTRWEELLMLYRAEHGRLPPGNADRLHPIGRLNPG